MTTIKDLIRECLEEETQEQPNDLDCYYQANHGRSADDGPVTHCNFDDLPEDDFDAGYGGTNGPALIAFTDKYIYVSSEYDGSEGITAVPRHPDHVGDSIHRV